MKWKEILGACIPRYVPNWLVTGVMQLLSLIHKTSKKQVDKNRIHNTMVLVGNADTPETRSFFEPGSFIENQSQWKSVRFGGKYTMAYGGCGIFAVYNAMVAPGAVRSFFLKQGYKVCMTGSRDKAKINALGEEYDTFIVTVYKV